MTEPRATSGDVRMRGFVMRSLVEDAVAWIDETVSPLQSESIPLNQAAGRILAADVIATIDVPAFARSAMDGYALRGAETSGAGEYNPLSFRIVGVALPGRPWTGDLPPGTAVRIMTGAPIPKDADAILPVEFATETAGTVNIQAAVPPGKHVGQQGEDVRSGVVLLRIGRRLRPQDAAISASVGQSTLSVYRQPKVRVLVTGNELVPPGRKRGPHQIFDSNSSMLAGLVERDGGIVEPTVYLQDDRAAIRAALLAPGADVILVSGGSSVGAEDHAPSLVAELGELAIHGVAMRPSSPAGMGKIGSTLVFLLPGNPVSCLCAYDFFAGRGIRQLGGRRADWPYVSHKAKLARKLVSAVGRVDYARVQLVDDQIEPLALSGASILSSTVRADGFVIIPAESEGFGPGTELTVFLYDSLSQGDSNVQSR